MTELAITAIFILVGFFVGGSREKKHFEELKKRENFLLDKVATRTGSGKKLTSGNVVLVTGSVVIASDYFKNFVGQLKNFFGGSLGTHETLLDRARREAVCRMKEQAYAKGAKSILDLHIETSFIDQMGVEVSAYGTAIIE
jgi:uncharacterized protein YbjQ (UPF0145 family)